MIDYNAGYNHGWVAAKDGLKERWLHLAADQAADNYAGSFQDSANWDNNFNDYYIGYKDGWNAYRLVKHVFDEGEECL